MEKFSDYDFKRLHPDDLDTVEECAYVMRELDKIISQIEAQFIDMPKLVNTDSGEEEPSYTIQWYASAKKALKYSRIARQVAQERRGVLSREAKRKNHQRLERLFIDASMVILPKETVIRIWDEAHRMEVAGGGSC